VVVWLVPDMGCADAGATAVSVANASPITAPTVASLVVKARALMAVSSLFGRDIAIDTVPKERARLMPCLSYVPA
jgi:hypothetical protein